MTHVPSHHSSRVLPVVLISWTLQQGRHLVGAQVGALKRGSSGTYAALGVRSCLKLLETRPSGASKRIVIVSDGNPNMCGPDSHLRCCPSTRPLLGRPPACACRAGGEGDVQCSGRERCLFQKSCSAQLICQ